MEPQTFTLTITLGNAAMQTRADVGEALMNIGENVAFSVGDTGTIRDANGNTVGSWKGDWA